ncbi:MazG-like family protein [Actinoplanes sichuanensis]|uniref:MazG-like family protein n=1 Tax=Actinoplanes sichuanensis TaxID=512349 RepID=A0ABW4AUH8_9ACTN|nr:MazG-like family protein [Actinoplanes sichuanensis]BEL07056.1 MazG-like family protein [Actinoplanes sichuanensis]
MDDMIWDAARRWQRFLDDQNGDDPLEIACRIMKVTEEAGEATQAWIGMLGQNPRKGVTHTRDDVVGELADVVFTALVAIASLGADPRQAIRDVVTKANGYLPTP